MTTVKKIEFVDLGNLLAKEVLYLSPGETGRRVQAVKMGMPVDGDLSQLSTFPKIDL